MKIAIIIPVYNEQAHLELMLNSVVGQTMKATQVIIVDDNSTDNTPSIIKKFVTQYSFIDTVTTQKSPKHSPGSKVVEAFYEGYQKCNPDTQLIGKFDADIILPAEYLEKMVAIFSSDTLVGIASGNLYIKKETGGCLKIFQKKQKFEDPSNSTKKNVLRI